MKICLTLPPPVDTSERAKEQAKAAMAAQRKMRSLLADMFATRMLESEDFPENKKANVRLLLTAKALSSQLDDFIHQYCKSNLDDVEGVQAIREEAYQLFSRIKQDIDTFNALHPLPVDTQD